MHGGFDTMPKTITERALASMVRPLVPASFPLGRAWFVAGVMGRQEAAAASDIRALGFDVFCPMQTRPKRERGRRVERSEPLFAGYIFASFDRELDDWGSILEVDGVMDILSNGQLPVRVPDVEIQRLRQAEQAGVFDFTSPASSLAIDERVEITEGPFAGLIGRVRKAAANKRVKILLDALGAVDVDPTFLRKV